MSDVNELDRKQGWPASDAVELSADKLDAGLGDDASLISLDSCTSNLWMLVQHLQQLLVWKAMLEDALNGLNRKVLHLQSLA